MSIWGERKGGMKERREKERGERERAKREKRGRERETGAKGKEERKGGR